MTDWLDIETTYRVAAFLFVVMSLVTWLVMRCPWGNAAMVWCTGGSLVGAGMWLISLRGDIHEFWSYGIAQTSLLAAFLVLAQALRMDMGKPWRWRSLVLLLLLYVTVIVFGFEDKHSHVLAVIVRSVNTAGLLALTMCVVMLARQERSWNTGFMVAGYVLITVGMLVAAVATALGRANLHAMQDTVFGHLLGLMSLLTVLMSYMGYLGLMLERSQRVNTALRQAQWQAQQWRERRAALTTLDRQHALSVLADSLGHAIVQPLTAAQLHVQLARRMLQSDRMDAGSMKLALAQVLDGLRRSAELVARIRNFLKAAPAQTAIVRLNTVVHDAVSLLRQEMMYRHIEFIVTVRDPSAQVLAEALPLTQALVQVLRNAMQAVQGRQRPVIALSLQTSASEAWVEVFDSGPGFPESMLARVGSGAQPQVEPSGQLGLYMVQGILSQFQGRLSLENDLSGGARVRLILPLTQGDEKGLDSAQPA